MASSGLRRLVATSPPSKLSLDRKLPGLSFYPQRSPPAPRHRRPIPTIGGERPYSPTARSRWTSGNSVMPFPSPAEPWFESKAGHASVWEADRPTDRPIGLQNLFLGARSLRFGPRAFFSLGSFQQPPSDRPQGCLGKSRRSGKEKKKKRQLAQGGRERGSGRALIEKVRAEDISMGIYGRKKSKAEFCRAKCRDCENIDIVDRLDFRHSSPPRCSACGGMLDKCGRAPHAPFKGL